MKFVNGEPIGEISDENIKPVGRLDAVGYIDTEGYLFFYKKTGEVSPGGGHRKTLHQKHSNARRKTRRV
jgi:hypothetical protein